MSHNTVAIPTFSDNYVWTIIHQPTQHAAIVDPGAAQPVIDYLAHNQLELNAILITHHHHDHVGGVSELVERFKVPVYGPATESIPCCDHPLQQGHTVVLSKIELELKVLDIPGHTAGHIAYCNDESLFCGDTLFSAGCGRLFEGSAKQMHDSLSKLAELAKTTQVFCAHEYTLSNLKFARQVEPDNSELKHYNELVQQQRAQHKPSLPTTIEQELKVNPFLRTAIPAVHTAAENKAGKKLANTVEVFAALRHWKDHFLPNQP